MKIEVNEREDSAQIEMSFADRLNLSAGELAGKLTPVIQQLIADTGREVPMGPSDTLLILIDVDVVRPKVAAVKPESE